MGLDLSIQGFLAWLPLVGMPRNMTKVRPHLPQAGETYCLYEIFGRSLGGALKPGTLICLYCPPGLGACPQLVVITPAMGIAYSLGPPAVGGCQACPNKNTYELLA
jgi:hypothetical protein